jgi:two-component sensor histidine kinase
MTGIAYAPTLSEQVLLQELNHRISNEFQCVMNLLSLTAARSRSQEVKAALAGVTELLQHYAQVHRALQIPQRHDRVDAADYLRKLCLSIRRSKLEHTQIDLALAAPPLVLQADECWLLGMIVYELITNAARHAFAGDEGDIRVQLSRAGAFVQCKVMDNGSAPAQVQQGRGLKIIEALIRALGGRFKQEFGSRGSVSILVFPYGQAGNEKADSLRSQSSAGMTSQDRRVVARDEKTTRAS